MSKLQSYRNQLKNNTLKINAISALIAVGRMESRKGKTKSENVAYLIQLHPEYARFKDELLNIEN